MHALSCTPVDLMFAWSMCCADRQIALKPASRLERDDGDSSLVDVLKNKQDARRAECDLWGPGFRFCFSSFFLFVDPNCCTISCDIFLKSFFLSRLGRGIPWRPLFFLFDFLQKFSTSVCTFTARPNPVCVSLPLVFTRSLGHHFSCRSGRFSLGRFEATPFLSPSCQPALHGSQISVQSAC